MSNIYLYSAASNTFFDIHAENIPLDSFTINSIKENLFKPLNERVSFVSLYMNNTKSEYMSTQKKYFYFFWPDFGSDNAIIFETNSSVLNEYDIIQKNTKNPFFVFSSKGDVIYGENYDEYISQSHMLYSPEIKRLSANTVYKHGSLYCYFSPSSQRWYIFGKANNYNFFGSAIKNKDFVFIVIMILLSVAAIMILCNWIPKIAHYLRETAFASKEEKLKKKEYAFICEYLQNPSKDHSSQFISSLISHIDKPYYACIQIHIENFKTLYSTHAKNYADLYLVGVDNIAQELFLQSNISLMLINTNENVLEYIAGFDIPSSLYYDTFCDVAQNLNYHINSYIDTNISIYTGYPVTNSELPKSYGVLSKLHAYRYLRENYGIIDPRCLIDEISVSIKAVEQTNQRVLSALAIDCANAEIILSNYLKFLITLPPEHAKASAAKVYIGLFNDDNKNIFDSYNIFKAFDDSPDVYSLMKTIQNLLERKNNISEKDSGYPFLLCFYFCPEFRKFLLDLWLLVSEDFILWIIDLRNIGINSLISSVFHLLERTFYSRSISYFFSI